MDALALGFDQVATTLPLSKEAEDDQWYGSNHQPPNVLNLALRIFNTADDMSDAEWVEKIYVFVNNQKHILAPRGIRCIFVVLCHRRTCPSIPTRTKPPFQLQLRAVLVERKQIHIYHGVARENHLDRGHRFFCALICPGHLSDDGNTADCLISEADRYVTSILDTLEIVSVSEVWY